MIRRRLFLAALVVGGASCGDTSGTATIQRSFDRPTDLAFGCYGRTRILGDNGMPDPTDEIKFVPQPVASCAGRSFGGPTLTKDPDPAYVPPGQEGILNESVFWYGFAIQPTSGTMTVVNARVRGPADERADYIDSDFAVEDGDPFIPGQNALAIGSTPVAIATDTAGCHVLAANAGTCDLSVIDVAAIADESGAVVDALPITANGMPLAARPAAMAAVDLATPIGQACPATPVGVVYIAYPECHAVAAVDAATGEVVSSIRFAADGTASLGGADLSCPRECGAREPLTDGARPVALDIVRDPRIGFQKLAIGVANRPALAVVTLDATGRPGAVTTYDLDGDVGVTDLAISKQITMGGITGQNDGGKGTEAEFVYAIATDNSVRVVEVLNLNRECETQGDPRFLVAERDERNLICIPVGDVATPPRRPGATGPGINMSSAARPVSVVISDSVVERATGADPSPSLLAGHFAAVSMSNGFTLVINIDDDNYADTYSGGTPLIGQVTSAAPHQVRDGIDARGVNNVTVSGTTSFRACEAARPIASSESGGFVGAPRIDARPSRLISAAGISQAKTFALPYFRQDTCVGDDSTTLVTDMAFASTVDRKLETFPDWRALPGEEDWTFTWQGLLTADRLDGSSAVDGPQIRTGTLQIEGGGMTIADGSAPYCAAGVEARDIVTLRGCDASRGDSQCGVDEICYVHPDATVAAGACLPKDRSDELAGLCRDFLVSIRRYSVQESFAGRLTLRERVRELRTTPATGCTSTEQCQQLADYEETLTSDEHPKDDTSPSAERTYACEPDPYRPGAGDRCVMTCATDSDCADGTLCRVGHCIEGIVPSPQCALGLQRYDLRAADAFVAIGSRTGYLHPFIADSTGKCVRDPAASPLMVGRFPLTAPPCVGDGPTDVSPNPCTETVEHTEQAPDYAAGTCDLASNTPLLRTRMTTAMRFENPLMRLRLVDLTYPGDATCRGDRGGTLVDVPVTFTGLALRFHLEAGFSPLVLGGTAVVQPANLVRAPDGGIWVVDAGDIDDNSASTPNLRGQLMRSSFDGPLGAIQIR